MWTVGQDAASQIDKLYEIYTDVILPFISYLTLPYVTLHFFWNSCTAQAAGTILHAQWLKQWGLTQWNAFWKSCLYQIAAWSIKSPKHQILAPVVHFLPNQVHWITSIWDDGWKISTNHLLLKIGIKESIGGDIFGLECLLAAEIGIPLLLTEEKCRKHGNNWRQMVNVWGMRTESNGRALDWWRDFRSRQEICIKH